MTTTSNVLNTTFIRRSYDPLAQSFVFPEDTIITKTGLFFAAKDPTKSVVVQVRNVVNGYPGVECYASSVLTPSQVNVSATGTVETVVTFDQPVYCKADEFYCICILSDANTYQMFIAELGKKDLITQGFVTTQPYSVGVLFSSSNSFTWSAHQAADLKFKVYRTKYTNDGEVVFNNITDQTMVAVCLAVSSVDFKNNGIDWFYKIGSGAWTPIATYVDRELGAQVNNITLKAVIRKGNYISPMLANDCINLISLLTKSSGTYISREVTMDEAFTNIRVVMDLNIPTGTTCSVYVQCADNANPDWIALTNPSVVPVSEEYLRHEWTLDGLSTTKYRVKVVLTTNNPVVRPYARRLMSILKY